MSVSCFFPTRRTLALVAWVVLLAFFFANVEIQIEGSAGWAANLPTWRIEKHWLLDIFWGGRPMTGYHAWVFPFVALFFHLPPVFNGQWSWRIEARLIACIMVFWLAEDFLWFVLNPAYGLARFTPANVPWHIHWLGVAPTDYWTMSAAAIVLFFLSRARERTSF
ncbi:hypothetical protein WL80_25205 [Burkholderia ubonensis]|uniref:hypothetical protein n=1 Tax=Burkholderia ubonensis TaxID=101571 RepID=UPI0007529854|nr:hypothetical protein [Burkholderia ubonensis]KWE82897.1 hypothetical protein WL80_25205 [Burkholderia ubonensis]